jgi:hypothetical protein
LPKADVQRTPALLGTRLDRGGDRVEVRQPIDHVRNMLSVLHMKMIQVRNIPDQPHRSLEERAAREGTTMSDLILGELPRLAHRPSPPQLLERIRQARSPSCCSAGRPPRPSPHTWLRTCWTSRS